jgi:ABC-type phosphate transport system substrate-binding protein
MSRHLLLTCLLALSAVCAAEAPADAATDGFVLVCNAKLVRGPLSKADVKSVYTGKIKTLGGKAIVVVIRGEDDLAFSEFVDRIFGVATKTLLSKIKQEVFKGDMTKPFKATSDDEVIQRVTASPGTIGVVSAMRASGLPKGVVVIEIGG